MLTYEARSDHHKRAVSNWRTWKESYDVTHVEQPWPDNISFHNTVLQECQGSIADEMIDGVRSIRSYKTYTEKNKKRIMTLELELMFNNCYVVFETFKLHI